MLFQTETLRRKVFYIRAERFDFVLPEAVYSFNYYLLCTGELDIEFISFPEPGESRAHVILKDVTMICHRNKNSNSLMTLESQLHADNSEIFIGRGQDLEEKVQILHSTKSSLFLTLKSKEDRTHLDIIFLSLLYLDIVCL